MRTLGPLFLAAVLSTGLATPGLALVQDAEFAGSEVTPEVAKAARLGLEYLASHQLEDGGWEGRVGYKVNQDYNVLQEHAPHVGVTALAGMAFLAGGHLPGRGPHGDVLDRAIRFLLGQVNDLGFVTGHQTRMYSHAFATLFLAEVYGMTAREDVGKKLQQAVDLIVASQNAQGSWRYEPFALESDMSITVCQLMALRAARNIGIKVPTATIDRSVDYVMRSLVHEGDEDFGLHLFNHDYYDSQPGAFRYQIANDSRSSFALTAAGVTSLYHAARYDQGLLRESLAFLQETQERVSRSYLGHYFYYYGHYYAVQAMFITGRDHQSQKDYWSRYWTKVSGELLRNQQRDGSWPNAVGPGPNFGTAVACIVLQTPYRYLPILQR